MASEKQAVEFNLQQIEFVTEQDGISERELKAALRNRFHQEPAVLRAYLAVLRHPGESELSAALCLVALPNSEPHLVPRIADVFSKMFSASQYLDVIFLNAAQEATLSKVCLPFFNQPSVTP